MNLLPKVFCFLCLVATTSLASAEALNAFAAGVQNGFGLLFLPMYWRASNNIYADGICGTRL